MVLGGFPHAMADLLHELGLDEEDVRWQDLAICQFMPTKLFYEDYLADEEVAKAIDSTCLTCPVIKDCFMHAAESGEDGTWGGVFWTGSGKPDKNANAHKTQEVWDEIHRRVS
jgi:hypothetical protein